MRVVFIGSFDPITESELSYAKQIVKERNLKELCLIPWGNGELTVQQRSTLLAQAIKPFHKLTVITEIRNDDEILTFEEGQDEEEKVRHGYFKKAPASIRSMLHENGYYYDSIAKYHCTPSRYLHSVRVAETAAEIAKYHKVTEQVAYRAGLLHDITKRDSEEEMRKVIALYKPEWLSISYKVWHSFTATIFLKQNMDLYDDAILYAITHHTLGDGNTDLARILYIADKIEPGRGYDTTQQMNLAKKNLKEAVDLIKTQSKQYILEKEGIHV